MVPVTTRLLLMVGQGWRNWGRGCRGPNAPQIFSDQLTLSQPESADYADEFTTHPLPPDFQTCRHPCRRGGEEGGYICLMFHPSDIYTQMYPIMSSRYLQATLDLTLDSLITLPAG